jgi:hypothetical protein
MDSIKVKALFPNNRVIRKQTLLVCTALQMDHTHTQSYLIKERRKPCKKYSAALNFMYQEVTSVIKQVSSSWIAPDACRPAERSWCQ